MSSAKLDILKCLCRLCAKQDKYCVDVFSNDGTKHLIRKKIRLCLPITIKENDYMPQQICLSCLNKLDICYELYSGCVAAQSTIMKLIESPDVTITGVCYPNPFLKVRKAVGLDSSPNTSASSPISLKDFLKQDYNQPADICPQTKSINAVSDITPQRSANEANNETNAKLKRHTDSGYLRIKVRKLDTDLAAGSELMSVDGSIEQRIHVGADLGNNNISTQTVEGIEVSTSDQVTTVNISTTSTVIPNDSSTTQCHLLPKITNLCSLAKPSVPCIMPSTPTTNMTSDSTGFEAATQSLNDIQSPKNVYLTSISNSIVNPCTQILANPISSTYIASQSLVPNPLVTSTYISSPPDDTHQVTQAITPNYLIQQQPLNSEAATSNALVYMNTLNSGTNFLPLNTSQQINFTVSSTALHNNNNILVTQDLAKQPSFMPDTSGHFNEVSTNTTASETSTTANSNIFVAPSSVMNTVKCFPFKTSKREKKMKKNRMPQTKLTSKENLQNFLLVPSNSETCQQNIKKGKGSKERVTMRKIAPKVSVQVPNTPFNNDILAKKISNNNLGPITATTIDPISVPHSGLNDSGTPHLVLFEQNIRTVASISSDHKQQIHTISSSRTSLDNNSLSTTKKSQAMEHPSADDAKRGYVQFSRPAQYSTASSTLSKSSASSPTNIRETSLCPTSATISQGPTNAVLINGTATVFVTASENSVSAERDSSVVEVKQENKFCSIRTSQQQDDTIPMTTTTNSSSSSTDSPGSENQKANVEKLSNENMCPYCNKCFVPEILIHHKALHFRETFFTCIDCGKNFKTNLGLQTHRCQVK